jgi:hypothetical protein
VFGSSGLPELNEEASAANFGYFCWNRKNKRKRRRKNYDEQRSNMMNSEHQFHETDFSSNLNTELQLKRLCLERECFGLPVY